VIEDKMMTPRFVNLDLVRRGRSRFLKVDRRGWEYIVLCRRDRTGEGSIWLLPNGGGQPEVRISEVTANKRKQLRAGDPGLIPEVARFRQ